MITFLKICAGVQKQPGNINRDAHSMTVTCNENRQVTARCGILSQTSKRKIRNNIVAKHDLLA